MWNIVTVSSSVPDDDEYLPASKNGAEHFPTEVTEETHTLVVQNVC